MDDVATFINDQNIEEDKNDYPEIKKMTDEILKSLGVDDPDKYDNYREIESCVYGLYISYHYLNSYLDSDSKVKDDILNFSVETVTHDKLYLLDNFGLSLEEIKRKDTVEKVLKGHLGY